MTDILTGARKSQYSINSHSQMAGEAECFSCVYWPFKFHFLRTMFISLAYLLIAMFDFLFSYLNSLYILDINSLPDAD